MCVYIYMSGNQVPVDFGGQRGIAREGVKTKLNTPGIHI